MPGIQELFQLLTSNIWIYGGSFLLVLSILVFVHEFGHYIVARWCGVRVETFSIGFGREIFGRTDKHGTRWKFSLVPLGGYVKMFGDVDPASAGKTEEVEINGEIRAMSTQERKSAFFAQAVWKRMAIVFAGPAINYIFAVIILAGLYMFYGQPVTPPQVSAVIENSAADQAGFKPHDMILSIGDRKIARFEDVRREVAIRLDEATVFVVERDGEVIEITAAARRESSRDHHGFSQSRGLLGVVSPGNAIAIQYIKTIDGIEVENVEQSRALLEERMGQTFNVTLDRGPIEENYVIRPLAEKNAEMGNPDSITYNSLVIADGEATEFIRHGLFAALGSATLETYNITVSTLDAIGQMFTGQRSATELGGIIRIGAIAGDMAQSGLIALITFTALLSINLGLINLFPIPMLDGGHLVFYVAEALRGRPLSEQIQEYAFRFGLAILVGIMVFANLNDIMQLMH